MAEVRGAAGLVFCHAYPLECQGISAARSAVRRVSPRLETAVDRAEGGMKGKGAGLPACTPGRCFLFETVHPEHEGREL